MLKKMLLVLISVLFLGAITATGEDQFKKTKKISPPSRLQKSSVADQTRTIGNKLQSWVTNTRFNSSLEKKQNTAFSVRPAGQNNMEVDLYILKDNETRMPYYVEGLWSFSEDQNGRLKKNTAQAQIKQFLKEQTNLLQLESADDEFKIKRIIQDKNGSVHVRLQQIYKGLDVWGKDIVVHSDESGAITGFNGRYAPTPAQHLEINEKINAAEALEQVKTHLNVQVLETESCEKKFYIRTDGSAVLVWHAIVRFGYQRWYYFIDALNGGLVHRIDYTMTDGPTTGTGVDLAGVTRTVQLYQQGSTYFMMDLTKPMYNAAQSAPPQQISGGIVLFDIKNAEADENTDYYYPTATSTNNWPANAVSAATFMSNVYDYYKNVHNRSSIDGSGMTLYTIINLGTNYANAFWNGKAMWFGNGDGQNFSDLCGALDVIAHEFTHGVTQYTSNLIYENQSGALNESMSDIFGAFTEWYIDEANGDWLIGEDVTTPGVPGDALRDIQSPSSANAVEKLPTKMSEYVNMAVEDDNGGVHTNCSIVARACVLIAQSIGRQKTEQIFYRMQTHYLTQSSQLIDARLTAVKAAQDLYGSTEEQAVKTAFDQVEIYSGNATPPPQDYSPVSGDQWILATGAIDKVLYKCTPDASIIQQLTLTQVNNKPTISDDGSYLLFVDVNNDLIGINSDGTGETNITEGAVEIGSVALSPDEHWLAYTSIYIDTTIYILDLVGDDHKTYQLYSPVTMQNTPPVYDVLYADAMDWSLDSQYILFDCYHETPTASGWSLNYWSIKLMRASNGGIFNIFGALPEGDNIGNPSFASTNDYIFAYDYVDSQGNTAIYAANLETGEIGTIIADNGGIIGRPSYSPPDDQIAYQTYIYDNYSNNLLDGIAKVQLYTDKINAQAGTQTAYLLNATFPNWFAIGTRTEVDDEDITVPVTSQLEANYPNPFNPETVIPFTVSKQSDVNLRIYTVTGRLVDILLDKPLKAGFYQIPWQGRDKRGNKMPSGVYIYRLDIGRQVFSGKMILVR